MSMITGDWQEALSDEFRKDYYKKLYIFCNDLGIGLPGRTEKCKGAYTWTGSIS